MRRGIKLEDLPPRMRAEAERQLGSAAAVGDFVGRGAAELIGYEHEDFSPKVAPGISTGLHVEGAVAALDNSWGRRRASARQRAPQNTISAKMQREIRNIARRLPNKTEAAFRDWFFCTGDDVRYEALMFRMPSGNRYSPDWVLFSDGGCVQCFEVKGEYRLPSHGGALKAFREARAAFPHVEFRWFEKVKGGRQPFVEKYAVPVDVEVLP